MRLAPVRCRVLLHSLLPIDNACSSSSLSTTVSNAASFSSAALLDVSPAVLREDNLFFLVHHKLQSGSKSD